MSLQGKKLGAYRIEALLGSGGMGEVYRGVHEALGRPVAVKTLRPEISSDRASLDRFFAEARAVNVIRHENIVEVTDLVSEPGEPGYMVMELLDGCTLTQAIRDAGRIAPERAARIAAQIAGAIQAAHDKGIVHRDLKPDNVFLIRRAGSRDYVKILDFGVARLRPEVGGISATKTGAVIGTPAYMSPEQAEGTPVTHAADIYALGVILFHMLTGRLPFEGPSLPEVLFGHVAMEPPRVEELSPEVPAALAALVEEMLGKKPADRPASMAETRARLLASVGLEVPDEPDEHGVSAALAGASSAPAVVTAAGYAPGSGPVSSRPPQPVTPPAGSAGATVKLGPARAAPAASAASPVASSTGVRVTPAPDLASSPELPRRAVPAQATPVPVAPRPPRPMARILAAGLVALALMAAAVLWAMRDHSGARAPSDGPAVDVAALRARLDAASAGHGEPSPPPSCATRDAALLGRLVVAAESLAGGAPGAARAQDADTARVLAAEPAEAAEYWHWLAKARLFAGDAPDSVLAAAERAMTLCDRHAAAYSVAGTVRFRAGQAPEAEALYREALAIDSAFATAEYNLGLVLLEQKRVADGLIALGRVLERQPDNRDALLARGQAHLMARDAAAAIRDLERARTLGAPSGDVLWLLGLAYGAAGRDSDARDAFCAASALGHAQAAARCSQ